MKTSKDLIKYLRMEVLPLIILGVILVALGIWVMFSKLILGIIIAVVGVLLILAFFAARAARNKYIADLEASGELKGILEDFDKGAKYLKGKIICGNVYLFARGKGKPIKYEDITNTYQEIKQTDGSESTRKFLVKVKKKGKVTLAVLKSDKDSEAIISQIIGEIKARNPQIGN